MLQMVDGLDGLDGVWGMKSTGQDDHIMLEKLHLIVVDAAGAPWYLIQAH